MAKGSFALVLMAAILALTGGLAAQITGAIEDRVQDADTVERLIDAGRYSEAEKLARDLLPKIEREKGSDSLETAALIHLLVEALWRGGKSSLPETRELAERALAIREARLGKSDSRVADSLARKADVLLAIHRYAMAGSLLNRALQIYEASPTSTEIDVARIHSRLGLRYMHTGPARDAEWHSALAVSIAASTSDPNELALAEMLTGLAEIHLHSLAEGSRKTAEPLARRALEIRRKALAEEHPLLAESAYLYGLILLERHRYQESFDLVSGAIESLERSLGPEHPLVAHYLFGLHHLQEILGDPVAAEASLWRSIAIFEKYPEMGLSAYTYDALGHLRYLQGDLVVARQLYERALGIAERSFGAGCIEAASSLNHLGRLETELGELEDARHHLERGLQIATARYGLVGEHTVPFDLSLAELHRAIGDLEVAEEFARRACAAVDCSSDPYHPESDEPARVLASVLRQRGKYREARELLSRVSIAREGAVGLRNYDVAENRIALADLMVAMGEEREAISTYEESLSILEELFGRRHPRAAATRLKIADCWLRLRQWKKAFEQSTQAEEIAREHSRLMLTGMTERVGLQYAMNRPSGLDRMFSLLIDRPESGDKKQAVEALIRSRALVLDEMADRHRAFWRGPATGDVRLIEDLTQSRKRLAYLMVQGPGDQDALDAFQRALANATRERDRAERVLAEANRRFRLRQLGRAAGLEEILASLPPGSGLLGLSWFRHLRLAGEGGEAVPDIEAVPSYLAYVLRADTEEIGLIDLGRADGLDGLVGDLRSEVDREARTPLARRAAREQAYRTAGERLRERLWDPVGPYLDGLERVFVVPDGNLHLVNLAALPVGQDEYLEEVGPRLHYLSAERDLVAAPPEVGGEGLLVIGNPYFDGVAEAPLPVESGSRAVGMIPAREAERNHLYRGLRSACESFQSMRFEPLPASEDEVRNVVRFWRDFESPPAVVALTRQEAVEASFKRLAPGRRVLHLSTHGFYLGRDCPVYDVTAPGGTAALPESPLLRSGLAFAGANHRQQARPEEDDGILTAEEVAALDLVGVEWAVLSACESGLGEVQTGEGVLGLRRAFGSAGVRTLIMSLWPVDDEVTRDWMTRLYRYRFVDGATTIDAVHRANLDLLAARRQAGSSTHPFYWAGFVAAGEWR